jgi:hypothetical protein
LYLDEAPIAGDEEEGRVGHRGGPARGEEGLHRVLVHVPVSSKHMKKVAGAKT